MTSSILQAKTSWFTILCSKAQPCTNTAHLTIMYDQVSRVHPIPIWRSGADCEGEAGWPYRQLFCWWSFTSDFGSGDTVLTCAIGVGKAIAVIDILMHRDWRVSSSPGGAAKAELRFLSNIKVVCSYKWRITGFIVGQQRTAITNLLLSPCYVLCSGCQVCLLGDAKGVEHFLQYSKTCILATCSPQALCQPPKHHCYASLRSVCEGACQLSFMARAQKAQPCFLLPQCRLKCVVNSHCHQWMV